MLDIAFIRDHKDLVSEGARKKHINFDVDELLALDEKRRALLNEVEDMRAQQNVVTDSISKTEDKEKREALIAEMRVFKEGLQEKEEELKVVMNEWQGLMLHVPNIPDISVPDGADDADNEELRKEGTIPEFSFTPKNHIDLMLEHNMVDFERGVKVAGFRGYILKNDGMMLAFALWRYFLDMLTDKGFETMMLPSLIRRDSFVGTGYLPQSEEDLYKTQDGEYLSGTAEVPTMGYFMGEVLDKADLPKKFASFSPCFRREAGSHGKDTKGLMRVHEFHKVEQVILCEASHEESVRLHEEIRENAEEGMRALGIPYRVVVNCGGDLGLGQVKKYDIEAWVPSEQMYRETHSASYFHDFQARRLRIQYRDDDGKLKFVHSLNNTAIATPRILISLVENHQQEDGSITIPEVLRPYMGKDIIKKV